MAAPFALAKGEFAFGDAYMLALVAFGIVLFVAIGALSHAHERPFSAALIYLAVGIVADLLVRGFEVTTPLNPVDHHVFVERASALAMIVALFTTGMRVRRGWRERGWAAPGRLLLVAMPLTIAAVATWGAGVMGLSLGAAIVLGAALAPTDPVLAGSLGVRPPDARIEERDRDREFTISMEAGVNDGLALPFLVLGLLVAEGKFGDRLAGWVGVNLVYAVAAALLLGYLAGRFLDAATGWLRERDFMSPDLDPWVGVAAAPLVYGAAELLGMYGFLAVIAAGYAFTRFDTTSEPAQRVHGGVHSAQLFLEIAIVLLIGLLLTWRGLSEPGVEGWLLVPVLFLIVRPAAVFASMLRSPLPMRDRVFLAWFGVKGVASINYLALALTAGVLAHDDEVTVTWTIIVVVIASIAVHGMTATPVTRALDGDRG